MLAAESHSDSASRPRERASPRAASASAFAGWTAGERPEALAARLLDGALVVVAGLPSVAALGERVRAILAPLFGAEPAAAEGALTAAEFRGLALAGRRRVAEDGAVGGLWRATLAALGFDPATVWMDRIRLRIVPSRTDLGHRRLGALPPHRDTWGSGIGAQINWWLPLFPLAATRTMLLWPHAFRQPIANDSARWNADAARRDGPLLPSASAPPPGEPLAVRIAPGEMLAFSAAHLHAGIADGSGLTRFSVDTRTVWEADRAAGRSAPNVDGTSVDGLSVDGPAPPRAPMWNWFAPPQRCMA